MVASHARHAIPALPVSVVIPAYRRPELVVRAVRSALAQRPTPPAQVIVVDDASGDGTGEAAAAAGATVVVLADNRGEAGARNAGIEAAQHEWIALLDSDDEWLPDHLQTVWDARAGFVLVSDSCISSITRRQLGNPTGRARVLRDPAAALWPANPSPPSCVLLRRDAARAVGGFRSLPLGADIEFWVRLLAQGQGLSLPEVGCRYVEHEGQVSGGRGADMRAAVAAIVAESGSAGWNTPRLRARLAAGSAWDDAMDLARSRRWVPTLVAVAKILRAGGGGAVVELVRWRLGGRRRGRAVPV